MSVNTIKLQHTANGERVTIKMKSPKSSRVKFGSVTISGTKPPKSVVTRNIELSTQALARVTNAIAKPGVAIRAKQNVPQYYASENEPGVYLRSLNGRTEHGRLVDGVFRVID
jgi:hypothetical protein